MDIDKLEAGREMNALVAEKVMGWHLGHGDTEWLDADGEHGAMALAIREYHREWEPSSDMSDAWQVIEKFRRGHNRPGKDAVACVVKMTILDCVSCEDCQVEIYSPAMAKVWATGSEMPLAICRAALKAVGYEQ